MRALIVLALLLGACAHAGPPPGPERPPLAAKPAQEALSARTIVERATAAAGGETWRRPQTLVLEGYAIFHRGAAFEVHERYVMHRVYPAWKGAAHAADGKVRIESWKDGAPGLLLAFDGARSYTREGPQPPGEADRQWSENFGFGVIRFALDEGYGLVRLPDDLVDGRPAFTVRVTDPAKGETLFSIAQDDFAVLAVGFATPRGWHERVYSDFWRKPGLDWVQPGRIRLFYNGVKQNEIIWRDFRLNEPIADDTFIVPAP